MPIGGVEVKNKKSKQLQYEGSLTCLLGIHGNVCWLHTRPDSFCSLLCSYYPCTRYPARMVFYWRWQWPSLLHQPFYFPAYSLLILLLQHLFFLFPPICSIFVWVFGRLSGYWSPLYFGSHIILLFLDLKLFWLGYLKKTTREWRSSGSFSILLTFFVFSCSISVFLLY